MSVIHEERAVPVEHRNFVFLAIIGAAFMGLSFRLWYLQVVTSEDLAQQAEASRASLIETLAPRGAIVDRNGLELAGVKSELIVTAQPKIVRKNDAVRKKVSEILGLDLKQVDKQIEKLGWRPYVPIPVATDISIEQATVIAESAAELPGFAVAAQPVRKYQNASVLGHILGYVGIPSADDVKRLKQEGLDPAAFVGKAGLERTHEQELMGKPGIDAMEVDSKRRPIRIASRDYPVPGTKLILGLDLALQKRALEMLGGRKGAVVAIDPRNGEVLCLVSSPSYDASLFLGGISQDDYQSLREDPQNPLLNRAIQGRYAPGSTFKIVTALAGYYAGKLSPSTHHFCDGALRLGGRPFKCLGHHGSIPFEPAFSKSCNTYFGQVALSAGPKYLKKAAEDLGLLTRTEIDLPYESKGIVPTESYIEKTQGRKWMRADSVLTGIGQGFVDLTPVQMANMVAAVANRGTVYRPHLVRAMIGPGEKKPTKVTPQVLHRVQASDEFWNSLHRACQGVVDTGTARASRIPGMRIGGKTGSAERKGQAQTHSWFVGFAPVDHPTIAIAVVVEGAGHGGEVAAPIACQLMAYFLMKKSPSVPMDSNSASLEPTSSDRGSPASR